MMAKKIRTKQEELQNKLVEDLLSQVAVDELFSKDGLFTALKKKIVEKVLEGELKQELGYNKNSKIPKSTSNRRNGSYEKKIIDDEGNKIPIEVPRDREGNYEPQLIRKGVRRFTNFDEKVISLYSRGMTMSEIQSHIEELYHTEVSKELI